MSANRMSLRCLCTGLLVIVAALWSPANSVAAPSKTFHIIMVVFRGCEDACKGFQDYWKSRDVKVNIEVLDAATDISRLREFVGVVKARKPDLLVTWGTSTAVEMLGTVDAVNAQRHVTDIPSLFMIVSSPTGAGLVRSLASSERNFSGTLYMLSADAILKAASMYVPLRRVGLLLNPKERNSTVFLEELRRQRAVEGLEVVARPIGLDAAGKLDAQTLPALVRGLADEKVDAIIMPPDSFQLLHKDLITHAAVERGMPVIATAEVAVRESEALLGVVNRYSLVGRMTALKAEQILVGGLRPRDIPMESPPGFSYIVNMQVAAKLHRYPPMKVLKMAEIVQREAP